MTIKVGQIKINPLIDTIEVILDFSEESDPSHSYASITVFVEDRDWLLSELRAEAIEKAKAFLLPVVSSPQS